MSFFGIPMRNGLSLGLGTVASLTNGPGFLPDELFYGGTVQGAWYDPSDLTTLFQDSAGTTPVTAVEQAVGLMLDKSKGLVLGPELVTNGDFSGGTTGWAGINATIAVVNGELEVTQTGANARAETSPSFATVVGQTYLVTGRLRVGTAASVNLTAREGTGSFSQLATVQVTSFTLTSVQLVFRATTAFTLIQIAVPNVAGVTAFADNISVRALPGNHAFQSTSASRPTLRARYNLLTRSEEFNDAVWQKNDGSSVTPNVVVAPDGTTTADEINLSASELSRVQQPAIFSLLAQYTLSIWLRTASGTSNIRLGFATDLDNITVTDQWQRFVLTKTASFLNLTVRNETAGGAKTLYAWGAQLVPTAVFPSNTYQRIGAATDYATGAAFPPYLFFDGTDDSMLTNSVDFATVTSDGQARRNLLLNPTQFDVTSSWTQSDVTVSANVTTAPDGSLTADKILESATNNYHYIAQTPTGLADNTVYTVSFYAKAAERTTCGANGRRKDGSFWYVEVNLANGAVTASANIVSANTVDAGNSWYRVVVVVNYATGASTPGYAVFPNNTGIFVGDPTKGIFLWGAQLETGSTATAFQNIGTDKMLVVAGVTKNSDGSSRFLVELSADASANRGFFITAPSGTSPSYGAGVNLGTYVAISAGGAPAPETAVLTMQDNGVTPLLSLRRNGSSFVSDTSSQGSNNFGNYPLYIGRRNNATFPFNGNLYSLIIAGQSYSSGQISSTESWVAAKTPLGTI